MLDFDEQTSVTAQVSYAGQQIISSHNHQPKKSIRKPSANNAQSNWPSLATHQTPSYMAIPPRAEVLSYIWGVWWMAKLGQLLCAWFADVFVGGYGR